jgi:outer membrane protein assembly factor BamE (lipoprotein component of BamABCDE complex)
LIFISFAPLNSTGQNCFGIGTPKNIVLQIMGRPTDIFNFSYFNEETWYYGISSVTFKFDKVYEYSNFGKNLKVWLGSIKKDAPPIKIGAIKQDVLNVMGTPTAVSVFESLNEETWYYGISSVTFQDNKVYEYSNFGKNLKVYVGTPTQNAPLIKKGSTKSDVTKSLGTPSSISKFSFLATEAWYYGLSSINFQSNLVYSWNDFGELKGHVPSINYYKGNEEKISYSEVLPYSLTFSPTSSSLTTISNLSYSQKKIALITDSNGRSIPFFAENGSYYGQISEITGRPKTVYVRGYYRKDGTYVRSYYRSKPIEP